MSEINTNMDQKEEKLNDLQSHSHTDDLEPEDEGFTRRGFVKVAVGGVCAAYGTVIGYPIYRYLMSPVEKAQATAAVKDVTLEDGAADLPKGSALMFKFGTKPSLLIHHEDDSWVAMDAVCTHLGCTVAYNKELKRIECACHDGVYDAKTGANVSGPPPKPLTIYKVVIANSEVKVSRA